MKLKTIIDYMEQFAPKELAEEWDNVGLLVGRCGGEITKILVCLDFSDDILEQAIKQKCEMIITHHPVIFKPLKTLTNPLLLKAVANNICVYSSHTNLDSTEGGVNEALASRLKLSNVQTDEMLRFGELSGEMTVKEFSEHVKACLGVSALRINTVKKAIKKVGILGGSGADFMELAIKNNCDAFVTGEASYHVSQAAESAGILLVCAGHYETEIPVVPVLCKRLKEQFSEIEIIEGNCKNPFVIA